MAIGQKYADFTKWLQHCGEECVKITFEQLQEIITIPKYAYTQRPAWANSSNPAPFAASWLNAGYIVSSINLKEQWVLFKKEPAQKMERCAKVNSQTINEIDVAQALKCGKEFYNKMSSDKNHRYMSWEHCHEAFKLNRHNPNEETIDLLCLHLAWYLASWGMLRNSFLIQKDYKIHKPIVKLLCEDQWAQLWDIEPEKMSEQFYAEEIMRLCDAIKTSYINSNIGVPTDTLLTKILLGTIGCIPAYDRYFKKAVSATGTATQILSTKSIMMLGKFYVNNKESFEALRKYCSSRVEYPATKILDMCFFEYGLKLGVRNVETD